MNETESDITDTQLSYGSSLKAEFDLEHIIWLAVEQCWILGLGLLILKSDYCENAKNSFSAIKHSPVCIVGDICENPGCWDVD